MASSSLAWTSRSHSPIVVLGSLNVDIYLEIDRIPAPGETVSAKAGDTLPGGKGANQAACASLLGKSTFMIGQVGKDANADFLLSALGNCGVNLTSVRRVDASTGHAVVMLQPGGQNSIIIVGGANSVWDPKLDDSARQLITTAGVLLLQREVPDEVNLEAAKIANLEGVPVVLDAGGADGPISDELLQNVTIFSPNETELSRITKMPTQTIEQVLEASKKLLQRGATHILVKLGVEGSLFVSSEGLSLRQGSIPAPVVVDTTGAGDTFTAAFAVALCEGQRVEDALGFASAAASICVRGLGAMPSMPSREAVDLLLQQSD